MILSLTYFIRTVVGIIDLALLTLLMYLLSFLPKKCLGGWFHPLFQYWCKVFVRALRCELFLHEKNHRILPKQFIVISNHPSCFEDIGMPALFNARYLAKHEVEHWFIVGRISRAAGTLYVKRDCKDSRQEATQMMLDVLANGDSIGIYPEGGCKGRRIHLPFKYGIFDLAIQSGVPILPVFLHYEAQESFEWFNQHLLHKLWTIINAPNRRINYYVYDPIDPKAFSGKEAMCEHVEKVYLEWQNRYLD